MKNILLLSIISLFFASCTERIDLDLNPTNQQKLVVNAWLTNEAKAHEVKLTLTGSYYENNTPEPATNATVTISDGDNIYQLTETTPGHYLTESDLKGEAGKTYTLNIVWNGETYTAASFLRPVTPIDSLSTGIADFQDDSDTLTDYTIYLYAQEPATPDDSYYWKTYLPEAPDDLVHTYWEIAVDDFVNGNPIPGAQIMTFPATPGQAFVFEQHSITDAAFDFLLAVQTETLYKGGLFDAPPSNIPSNVSNGALGYFMTSSVVRDTVVIE